MLGRHGRVLLSLLIIVRIRVRADFSQISDDNDMDNLIESDNTQSKLRSSDVGGLNEGHGGTDSSIEQRSDSERERRVGGGVTATSSCTADTRKTTNSIIRSRDSLKRGAVFLEGPVLLGNVTEVEDLCVRQCCDIDQCNTVIVKHQMDAQMSCYLFACGQPNVCLFTHNSDYSVVHLPSRGSAHPPVNQTQYRHVAMEKRPAPDSLDNSLDAEQNVSSSESIDSSSSSSSDSNDKSSSSSSSSSSDDDDKAESVDDEEGLTSKEEGPVNEGDHGSEVRRKHKEKQSSSSDEESKGSSESRERKKVVLRNDTSSRDASAIDQEQPIENLVLMHRSEIDSSLNQSEAAALKAEPVNTRHWSVTSDRGTWFAVVFAALLATMLLSIVLCRIRSLQIRKSQNYPEPKSRAAEQLISETDA